MKKLRFFAGLILICLLGSHFLAAVAAAHPLGNFTINHFAGLHLTQEKLTLDFILDMAEIPAFQEIAAFDTNGNGQAETAEAAGYHQAKCEAIQPNLPLQLNGRPAPLSLVSSTVEFPSGAGGLPTLRLTCNFQTAFDNKGLPAQIDFENRVYAERLGWREIVVSGDGVNLPGSLADMSDSVSRRLSAYPDDLLANPLDQRHVSFELGQAAGFTQPAVQSAAAGEQPGQRLIDRNDGFTQLITLQNLTLPSMIIALAVAFAWGAAHALTPGHGKTIVAAYLVGSRGTMGHALFLGLTTTITHTAGVFVLGFLTLFASQFILPEQLYPWLGVISGLLVVGIGLSLFKGRLSGLVSGGDGHHHAHDHSHEHDHDDDDDHHHHHHHHHGPGSHSHSHLPPDTENSPVTWRSLLALGVSGGLIPCPSALVVMLSAIALQRIGFGLILIVTFSLGLAGVLTAIGVVWVQARRFFEYTPRRPGLLKHLSGRPRLLQALPAVSALFITVVGAGITWQALLQTGVLSL